MIHSPDELSNGINIENITLLSAEDIGKKIKARMKEYGISQVILASKMHVSKQTVNYWLSGRNRMTVEQLSNICKILNCDMDYLTGRIKEKSHGKKYICEQTGLSEMAVNALIESKKISGGLYSDGVQNLLGDAFIINEILASGVLSSIGHDLNLALSASLQFSDAEKETPFLEKDIEKATELVRPYGYMVMGSEYAMREYINTACDRIRRILIDCFEEKS